MDFQAQFNRLANSRHEFVQGVRLGMTAGKLGNRGDIEALFTVFDDYVKLPLHHCLLPGILPPRHSCRRPTLTSSSASRRGGVKTGHGNSHTFQTEAGAGPAAKTISGVRSVSLSGEVISIVDGLKLSELPDRDYYPSEDQEQKPVLVLAIRREWVEDDELLLAPGRDWFRHVHQCGGVACHHLAFAAATELNPKGDAILQGMRRISDEYYGSDLFRLVTVDDLVRYRSVLREHLQVDCNRDYETFEEVVYPVDLEHLGHLTGDPIPEDLNDLVRWKYRRFTPMAPFGLWILGPNSD